MISMVNICNLALSHLGKPGEITSINPSDGSPLADACAVNAPLALDYMLSQKAWTFAHARQTLTAAANVTAPLDMPYAYLMPSDGLLRILSLHKSTYINDDDVIPFSREGNIIFCAYKDAPVMQYTKRVTDFNVLSPQFVVALSWLIAAYISSFVVKGDSRAVKYCEDTYNAKLLEAIAADSNHSGSRLVVSHTPSFMSMYSA